MPAHSIRVVTFDADGTIWDFATTMREALAATLQTLQQARPNEAGRLTVSNLIAHRREAESAFKGQTMNLEALRFAGFVRTLDAIGIRDEQLARDLTRTYLDSRFANARMFDDALPTIDRLRSHYRLGLLTNGNSYPDRLGVGDRFEFTIIAQEHGVRKPDPEFYELAIKTAGVPPSQILHVGDSIDNDILPARRAGMRVIWINRAGDEPTGGRQSLATIYSLTELPSFLGI